MSEDEWVLLEKVEGQLQAEILKGLLEAQGIRVWLNQQGAAHAYAVAVGTLGLVEILVPTSELELAKQVIKEYNRGDFENMGFTGSESGDDPD